METQDLVSKTTLQQSGTVKLTSGPSLGTLLSLDVYRIVMAIQSTYLNGNTVVNAAPFAITAISIWPGKTGNPIAAGAMAVTEQPVQVGAGSTDV